MIPRQSQYSKDEYVKYMQEVLNKHDITKDLSEEIALTLWNCDNKQYDETGFFEPCDKFLSMLEKYGLDQNVSIQNNIKNVLRRAKFKEVYEMIDLLKSKYVGIDPKEFFTTANTLLLDFDVKEAKEAIRVMKREKYDYKVMFLRCKELACRPSVNLIKEFRKIMIKYGDFENSKTIKAVAENVPSIFVNGNYFEIPKILTELKNSTYDSVRTNKYSKKEEVVQERLYQPLDRLLLSNGDILSMEDASEIKKLNQFLKDNGISLLEVFAKNTSIYRRAKYDIYAPAYELAIRLRAGNKKSKYKEVQQEINDIILNNPSWLVSITEESVQKGFDQSNELCNWNGELADIYHTANPKLSTKAHYCDLTKLLEVFEYVYQDKEIAKEKILTDARVKKIGSALTFERVFKKLEEHDKFKGNRDELVELVDANLDKMTLKNLPLLLNENQPVVKQEKVKRLKSKNDIKLDETSVKIYNVNNKQKIGTIVVDGNNLSPKMRKFFQKIIISASEAREEDIIEGMINYIAQNKTLLNQVNQKAIEKKKTVKDLPEELKREEEGNRVLHPPIIEDVDPN